MKMQRQQGAVGLVIILVVFLLGVGAYSLFQDSFPYKLGLVPTTEKASVQKAIPIQRKKGWFTFINNDGGYSIDYPDHWIITSEVVETHLKGERGVFNTELSVTRGDYSLRISTTTAGYGGVVCRFDDSSKETVLGPSSEDLGAPYELGEFLGERVRRNLSPIEGLVFRICTSVPKGGEGETLSLGTFEIGDAIVEVVYNTPIKDVDDDYLKTMDQILSTLKLLD